MAIHWGVDSFNPATSTPWGGTRQLWDLVVAGFPNAPEFWGRYLNGLGRSNLSKSEVQFLLGYNCRILPIFKIDDTPTGLQDIQRTDGETGLVFGARDASRAIQVAAAAGLTNPGFYIYVDMEWWMKPSADWLMGWFTGMDAQGFGGGVYCSPTSGFFTPGYCAFVSQYSLQQIQLTNGRMLWANSPQNKNICPVHPQSTSCSKDLSQVSFQPDNPPCDASASAIWQIAANCLNASGIPPPRFGGLVDQDLCNDDGWNGMYQPPSSGGPSQGDPSDGDSSPTDQSTQDDDWG
jgi:hypothetical protein